MNFDWNDDTIRWYQEANEYSGFFKKIAGLIAPKLEGYSTFCDMGCGLGLVDLELSKNIESITCIDINKEAINALKQSAKKEKLTNIKPLVMDCNSIDGYWDVIYASFFGSRNVDEFLPHCKKLITIVSKKSQIEFFFDKCKLSHENRCHDLEQALRSKGTSYSLTEVSFEFGQPLVSMEEASNFARTHLTEISPQVLSSFLAYRLLETRDKKYPYYIPRQKSMGIFEIQGEL